MPGLLKGSVSSLLAAAGVLVSVASPVRAGGSPENVLIIANPASQESMYLANYYRARRNIPESNVLYIEPAQTTYAAFVAANGSLDGVLGTLRQRQLEDHIDYIVLAGTDRFYIDAPGLVSDACWPVARFSLSGIYTMAHIRGEVAAGGILSTLPNQYFSTLTSNALGFDSNNAYLLGNVSTSGSARRYFIGAQLGYTGERGNTLGEILQMIDRSALVDGTRPAGSFYYMNNTADPVRNLRACGSFSGCAGPTPVFTSVTGVINTLGGMAEVLPGVLPTGRHNALGVLTGAEYPNIEAEDMTLLPGSFCDHLTSWAATFDNGAQVKMSSWIRKGASGTSGTVEEPCAYPGKFPHPNEYVIYYQGLSLGEMHLRSLGYVPFQQMLMGDPMTRPFARFPTVTPNLPGGTVSGTVQFTPDVAATAPGAVINRVEVLVDGVLRGWRDGPGAVTLNTQGWADGPHDVRVLAYDNTVVRNVGRAVGTLTTGNAGRSATLSPNLTTGDLSTAFTATIASPGAGTVQEVRLLHNGRVVAARPTVGALTVYGRNLGAGSSSLRAEILYTDGRRAQSAPVGMTVAYTGAPAAVVPVAFGYTMPVYRGGSAVIPLPAAFPDNPVGAVYSLTTTPAQATISTGTMNYRVITVPAQASGTDTLAFRVQTPGGTSNIATVTLVYSDQCYANCDGSVTQPFLNVGDFTCFLQRFAAGDAYANCDGSTLPPVLNVGDFTCFLQRFASGCD
jgi:hypothetical protein